MHAARDAFKGSWGLKVPGSERGNMLHKLAALVEKHADELAALETLNSGMFITNCARECTQVLCVGQKYIFVRSHNIANIIATLKYYAGWADKHEGTTIEVGCFPLCP